MSGNEIESDKCLTARLYNEEIELNSMHLIEQTDRNQTIIIEGNSSAIMIGNEIESDKCLKASLYKEDLELNSMHSIEQTKN